MRSIRKQAQFRQVSTVLFGFEPALEKKLQCIAYGWYNTIYIVQANGIFLGLYNYVQGYFPGTTSVFLYFDVSSEAHIEVVCCHDIRSIVEKSWQKG